MQWIRRQPAAALLLFAAALSACGVGARQMEWEPRPVLEPQQSGTTALLIGISVVDAMTVWVSGARGTWGRTTDGGATWVTGVVAGADSLQFRDVHALDATQAYLLSIGSGDASRIYRTSDGGATWTLHFRNDEPRAFYDCFAFWDARSGIAFSDSHDGHFPIIETTDGVTWTRIPVDRLPPANEGEGAFAASGTCVVAHGDSTAWIGTGASAAGARVLRTRDRGRSWSVAATPIVQGPAAGIASLAFRDARHGMALGGDIGAPDSVTANVAYTSDGGDRWTLRASPPFTGAVYGSAWVPDAPKPTLVAVGPRGLALTTNEGASWMPIDTLNHWSVAFHGVDRGWAVGPNGRITGIRLR
jgi:photosystem II stability/assembly factor-like uncharacterized protein